MKAPADYSVAKITKQNASTTESVCLGIHENMENKHRRLIYHILLLICGEKVSRLQVFTFIPCKIFAVARFFFVKLSLSQYYQYSLVNQTLFYGSVRIY